MMNKKFLSLSATAIAAALALAGCSTGTSGSSATSSSASTGSSMPGMDHGTGMMSSSAPAAAAEHNAPDTMFAQGMIPHHEQAVEMSEMMLQKKDIPASVTDLATRIKAAQAPEIETMTGWLKSWNEPATMGAGHTMNGMMGEDDLKQLEAAQGTEAAKLFLKQMIAHHEGAVTMAKTETAQGKNADAINLSKNIVTAQEAEIKEMQDLLATL
ncbi:DUF305 domain-containing protein [Pseudarthrobacter cellobiosi]|uniref:DUF305 domain-containing protein n=1 Tax=Pseudarthrobacter cellobiosi TaxID=2953654 RepID=UPI00208F3F7E|nr:MULTISPECIES: DUF305 domain-containing protein [unclassified Pseudarthrobacter]MCO4255570.1 DUF305 domain-containing protein [Pseudarthrobacter sp. HLT1-5]MCO4273613.1 DUF305 domain-containing protein [Pseudarthrobacter sp. HLT3-5]